MSGVDESGSGGNTITPAQCRAARGLLDWTAADLARKVGLGEAFVRDFEQGNGDPASGQIEALRSTLMAAGAVFSDGGVRLDRQGGDEGTRLGELTSENDR